MFTGATTMVFPGGILALPSNSGTTTNEQFAIVSEEGLSLSYRVVYNLQLTAGYSYLYWSHVVHSGGQVNRNVNVTNTCVGSCLFCGFRRNPNDGSAYWHDRAAIFAKIEDAVRRGATEKRGVEQIGAPGASGNGLGRCGRWAGPPTGYSSPPGTAPGRWQHRSSALRWRYRRRSPPAEWSHKPRSG